MKIIKYILIIELGILAVQLIVKEFFFDPRTFKFENYRTSKKFEEEVKVRFPIGSNIYITIDTLRKSGAECDLWHKKYYDVDFYENNEEYISGRCFYLTGFLSLHPTEHYGISLNADKNGRLLKITTERNSGLWW